MVKEYKIFKTANKTARENNLVIVNQKFYDNKKKFLFDFSLLEHLELLDREKEGIKKDALKNVTPAMRLSFYGKEVDNFTYFNGKAQYHMQRVYSLEGKLRYYIFSLARIEHHHCERKNIYENYTDVLTNSSNGYDEPVYDIEL